MLTCVLRIQGMLDAVHTLSRRRITSSPETGEAMYLQLRNNTYHFRFVVPPEYRSIVGKREIKQSLKLYSNDHANDLQSIQN